MSIRRYRSRLKRFVLGKWSPNRQETLKAVGFVLATASILLAFGLGAATLFAAVVAVIWKRRSESS